VRSYNRHEDKRSNKQQIQQNMLVLVDRYDCIDRHHSTA